MTMTQLRGAADCRACDEGPLLFFLGSRSPAASSVTPRVRLRLRIAEKAQSHGNALVSPVTQPVRAVRRE